MTNTNESMPNMTCAYPGCRLRLNRSSHTSRETVQWVHGSVRDGVPEHAPVPVPESELAAVLVCDFCSATPAPWHLGCKDFTDHLDGVDAHIEAHSTQHAFSSCEDCMQLIVDDDRQELARRALTCALRIGWLSSLPRAERRRMAPIVLGEIEKFHQRFFDNRDFNDFRVMPYGRVDK